MSDLFASEEALLQKFKSQLDAIPDDGISSRASYKEVVDAYASILRQLRTLTRHSDRTTETLYTSQQALLQKVHYDALTGIYSRRFLNEKATDYAMAKWPDNNIMFCIMMVDVDFFKKYNDSYGHLMGDTCLQAVASALSKNIRESDGFVARYGGEEFAVILLNTDEDTAHTMAERLLKAVADKNIPHKTNTVAPYVTVSIGYVTGKVHTGWNVDKCFDAADKALYISKQNGRNQVSHLNMEEESPWS